MASVKTADTATSSAPGAATNVCTPSMMAWYVGDGWSM